MSDFERDVVAFMARIDQTLKDLPCIKGGACKASADNDKLSFKQRLILWCTVAVAFGAGLSGGFEMLRRMIGQ